MAGLRGKALVAYLLVCTSGARPTWPSGSACRTCRRSSSRGCASSSPGCSWPAIVLALGDPAPLARAGLAHARHHRRLPPLRRQRHPGLGGAVRRVRLASVFVAAMPLWAAFFDAMVPGGKTVSPGGSASGSRSASWGARSSRASRRTSSPPPISRAHRPHPRAARAGRSAASTGSGTRPRASPYAAAAVQMARGRRVISRVGPRARRGGPALALRGTGLGAMAYLVVFGSLVGFTAFGYALATPRPRWSAPTPT